MSTEFHTNSTSLANIFVSDKNLMCICIAQIYSLHTLLLQRVSCGVSCVKEVGSHWRVLTGTWCRSSALTTVGWIPIGATLNSADTGRSRSYVSRSYIFLPIHKEFNVEHGAKSDQCESSFCVDPGRIDILLILGTQWSTFCSSQWSGGRNNQHFAVHIDLDWIDMLICGGGQGDWIDNQHFAVHIDLGWIDNQTFCTPWYGEDRL